MVVLNRFVGLRKFTRKSFFCTSNNYRNFFLVNLNCPYLGHFNPVNPEFFPLFLEYLRYLYCKRVHQLSKKQCITASIAFLMERCVQSMSMMALYHKDIVLFYKCMYLKIMFIKDHFLCLWFSRHSLIVTSRCVLYLC